MSIFRRQSSTEDNVEVRQQYRCDSFGSSPECLGPIVADGQFLIMARVLQGEQSVLAVLRLERSYGRGDRTHGSAVVSIRRSM